MSVQYSEYFNKACDNISTYTNCTNVCSVNTAAHANHYNYCSQNIYYNNGAWGWGLAANYYSNYSKYVTCSNYYYYINYRNTCSNYVTYDDHNNYQHTNLGFKNASDLSISWSSPWSGSSQNRTLDSTYISNSVSAIKQLRDNIVNLQGKLHQNADLPSALYDVADTNWDSGDIIDDYDHDRIKANLDRLWTAIRNDDDSSTPGTTAVNAGTEIEKAEWQGIANKVDQLAAYSDPSYINHVNSTSYYNTGSAYANGTYSNYSNS